MAPPAFLFSTIKEKIDEAEVNDLKTVFAPLYNHSAMPAVVSFEQIMQKIIATEPTNVLKQLRNHETKSPISFERIMERLRALGYFGANTAPAKVISFNNTFKRLAVAAAVLLFMVSSYFVYNKFNTTAKDGDNFAATNPVIQNNNSVSTIVPSSEDTAQQKNTAIPQNKVAEESKTNRGNYIRTDIRNYIPKEKNNGNNNLVYGTRNSIAPKQKTILVNGEQIPIYENDYLLSFASFSPDKLPSFLQVEIPVETQITIDKYSYFNITDGMGAMMKKMYATKKDSITPTRSARRQKVKLEKWKVADSAYFNQNSNVNPLDPRDLGNLILNK